MEAGLRRFWLEFDPLALRHETGLDGGGSVLWAGLLMGIGVTASDLDECLDIVQAKIFGGRTMPNVIKVMEDIDVSTLDEKHILPNMEPPIWRGIWFPRGLGDSHGD